MWLFRGAQSAVFYYAACTPCAQYTDRRKRKKDASRIARDPSRDALVTDQPVFFHQPVAFSTNAYWSEEIALGPGPPSRKAVRNGTVRAESQRNLTSLDAPSSDSSPMKLDGEVASPKRDKDKDGSRNPLSDRWNRFRYQREDEILWGIEVKGSSVGLSGRARADTAGSSKYYVPRVPEVNDLHPPVVCGPTTREETRWMLQPPPSAKVMEGKVRYEPSQRSRIGSPKSIPRVSTRPIRSTSSSTGKCSPQTNTSPDLPEVTTEPEDKTSPSAQRRPKLDAGSYFPPLPMAYIESTAREEASLRSHSPSPTTIASISPPITYTLEGRDDLYQKPPPSPLNSRSNSPSTITVRSPESKLNHHPHTDKREITAAADRPSSNGTLDSGKAFHPATPTSLWDLDFTQTYSVNIHDDHDGIASDDISQLHRIRPYRWSMNF